MPLSDEHVGPKILAKIKIYILTRAELLFNLCYEIPCSSEVNKSVSKYSTFMLECMKGTLKRLKKRENRHSVHNSQVTKNSLQNRNNSFSYISSCVKLYGAVGRFKNQGVCGGATSNTSFFF